MSNKRELFFAPIQQVNKRPYTIAANQSVTKLLEMRQRGDTQSFSTFNQLNRHCNDERIKFEEGPHHYFLDGARMPISVSGFISSFQPAFDSEKLLGMMFRKAPPGKSAEYRMPFSKAATSSNNYANMTKYDAVLQWEKNQIDGTNLHACIEHYFDCMGLNTIENMSYQQRFAFITSCPKYVAKDNQAMCEQFLKAEEYMFGIGWQIYRYEWNIFSEKYNLCGGVDAVFKRKNKATGEDEFCIVDWKRSSTDFKKNYGDKNNKTAFYPFETYPNTKFTHYQFQVNTYAAMLRDAYSINVKFLYIFQFSPTAATYQMHIMPNVENDMLKGINVWINHCAFKNKLLVLNNGSKGTSGPLTRTSVLHPEYCRPTYISAKVNKGQGGAQEA